MSGSNARTSPSHCDTSDGPREATLVTPSEKAERRKRFQPIVSCLECRRMKRKCDRNLPCGNCRKRGLSSICPGGLMKDVKGDINQILTLKNKIKDLESELAVYRRQQISIGGRQGDSRSSIYETTLSAAGALSDLSAIPDAQEEDHGQLSMEEHTGVSRFFGQAGAPYLLAAEYGSKGDVGETDHTDILASREGLFLPPPNTDLVSLQAGLPSKAEAEVLTSIYFQDASYINQILDPISFTSEYLEPSYFPDTCDESPLMPHQLAIMYLVLAIGAQMDLRLPIYNHKAEEYFLSGKLALALDSSTSSTFILGVYLMHRYLVNTRHSKKATDSFWVMLGMSMRASLALGLHRDAGHWNLSSDETESRRRIFWELYTSDVMNSMTQGRPHMISEAAIDAAFPSESQQADEFSSKFHSHRYRFAKLCGRINDLQVRLTPIMMGEFLNIDAGLRDLGRQWTQLEVQPINRRQKYQQLTGKLLVYEGLMFLHHKLFTKSLKSHSVEPLQSPYGESYATEIEASKEMIGILREALEIDYRLTLRFWLFFFHAFTALVHLAAAAIRSPTSSLANSIFAEIEAGVSLFEELDSECSGYGYLPALQRLRDRARIAVMFRMSSPDQETGTLMGLGTTLRRTQKQTGIDSTELPEQPDLASIWIHSPPQDMGGSSDQLLSTSMALSPWYTGTMALTSNEVSDGESTNIREKEFNVDAFLAELGIDLHNS